MARASRSAVGRSWILAFAVAVGGASAGGALAQSTDGDWSTVGGEIAPTSAPDSAPAIVGVTYVLPSSGAEIVVGDEVSSDDPALSDIPDQVILSTPGGVGAVAVLEGRGRPMATLEVYIGGFSESMESVTELDVQNERSLATGVYQVDTGSGVLYLYITVDAALMPGYQVIQVVIAGDDAMADSIALLRENVLIDGTPMMADTDESAIQAIVTEHAE